MKNRAVLMLFFIILAVALNAAPPRYQYSYYTQDSGLSRTMVEDITQDGNGCLWMATWSGLYRFDGKTFTNYKPEQNDSQGRQANMRFDRVYTDAFGLLWALSYDKALYRFELHRESFTKVECGSGISKIYRLSSDDFLLLTVNGTLLKVKFSDRGKSLDFEEYMRLSDGEEVNDIRKDAEDNVWVLTDKALYRNRSVALARPAYCYEEMDGAVYIGSDGGTIVEYINGSYFELDSYTAQDIKMICNIPGTLNFIIGSAEDGFNILNFEDWKLKRVKGKVYSVAEPKSLRDSHGNIWIYSTEGGICLFDPESCSLEPFYRDESGAAEWDAETNIRCAFVDRQDNVWIGGSWSGVGKAVLKEYKFTLSAPEGSAGDSDGKSVRALMQSSSGIIYAGTKDGKVYLLDKNIKPLTIWDAGGIAYSITEDSEGRIWLGTKGKGVIENTVAYDVGLPEFSPKRHGESGDPAAAGSELVYCVRQHGSRLWIASFDGKLAYSELNGGRRTFTGVVEMPDFPAEPLRKVRHIVFSPSGRMLVGGINGLYSCDNPDDSPELLRFERYEDVDKYDIQHILITADGTMYASSYGKGFLLFDGRRVLKTWTGKDGLLSDFVLSAVEDSSGNIWIVTYKGLNKLNPATGSLTGWSYDRIGHDLLFNEGEPVLTEDGNILLNTTEGILSFDPKEISNSSFIPKVFTRALYVSGKRAFHNSEHAVKMRSGESLSVDFTAVDMCSPESIVCFWRLDGGGRSGVWTRLDRSGLITLDRLRLGRHTLEMRSTNADGQDVNNRVEMGIVVWPEPQWTIIAILLLFIGFAAITNGLIHRMRLQKAGITTATPEEETGDGLNEEERRFKEALLACLQSNLDNGDITSDEIASALNISRSVLFEKCRAVLGKAPTEYLRDLRFEKAAEMIKEGSYPIAEIAYRTGFNDAHYFSKAFRKHYGMTPSEYRKSFKA